MHHLDFINVNFSSYFNDIYFKQENIIELKCPVYPLPTLTLSSNENEPLTYINLSYSPRACYLLEPDPLIKIFILFLIKWTTVPV